MDTMNLSIIISSIAGGAILGIKKTTSEFKKLAKAGGDVNEKIKIANETSINFFKKSTLSAFRTGVAISTITKPAIEFESAMADVKKVVDFDTPKQFEEMQSDILKLTRSLPLASSELAEIAASGGQLSKAILFFKKPKNKLCKVSGISSVRISARLIFWFFLQAKA